MSMFVCLLKAPVCCLLATLLRYISIVQSLNKIVNMVNLYTYLRCKVGFYIHDKTCAWNDVHNSNCNVNKYGNKHKKPQITVNKYRFFFFVCLFLSGLLDNVQGTGSGGFCACALHQTGRVWNESRWRSSGWTKCNVSMLMDETWFWFSSEQQFNGWK